MKKYSYVDLLELLEVSVEYIKYYNRKCDKYVSDRKNYANMSIKLDYHLFSFTQILFSLKDRLSDEFRDADSKINEFFERGNTPKTNVGKAIKLANEWKHQEGIKMMTYLSDLEIKKVSTKVKGKEIIPVYHIRPTKVQKRLSSLHKLAIYDNLSLFFNSVLNDVKNFLTELEKQS